MCSIWYFLTQTGCKKGFSVGESLDFKLIAIAVFSFVLVDKKKRHVTKVKFLVGVFSLKTVIYFNVSEDLQL